MPAVPDCLVPGRSAAEKMNIKTGISILEIPVFCLQKMGVEPTRYYYHTDLNRARLPIPPLLHFAPVITGDESYYKGIWGICQLLLLRK